MTNVKVRNIRTGEQVDHQITGWAGQRLYTVNPQGDRRTWTLQGVCFESARLRLVDPAGPGRWRRGCRRAERGRRGSRGRRGCGSRHRVSPA